MKTQKGFTLIELLVAISIITLLSSIAFFSYNTARAKSIDAAKKVETNQVKTALQIFHSNESRMPKNYTCNVGTCIEGRTTAAVEDTDGGYERSMQELVDAGVLSEIPLSPGGEKYVYYDYGPDNNIGALFGTTLSTIPPTTDTGGATCRPFPGSSVPTTCTTHIPIPGDADLDGDVDLGDLGTLASNYGVLSGATWATGDFNGDGAVNLSDLGLLAGHYGESNPNYCPLIVTPWCSQSSSQDYCICSPY